MNAMQEINLYQPKSKGVRGMLSAGSTATVFGVVGITLLGLWAFASWQINKLDAYFVNDRMFACTFSAAAALMDWSSTYRVSAS